MRRHIKKVPSQVENREAFPTEEHCTLDACALPASLLAGGFALPASAKSHARGDRSEVASAAHLGGPGVDPHDTLSCRRRTSGRFIAYAAWLASVSKRSSGLRPPELERVSAFLNWYPVELSGRGY